MHFMVDQYLDKWIWYNVNKVVVLLIRTLNAGTTGVSGELMFSTGTTSSGASGSISIGTGTASAGDGGDIMINVGDGNTLDGGHIHLFAGKTYADADSTGGSISIHSGYSNHDQVVQSSFVH